MVSRRTNASFVVRMKRLTTAMLPCFPTASGLASQQAAIGGTVTTSSGSSGYLEVQIDTNGDGTPAATFQTDANGNFSCYPQGLSPGPVTLDFRAQQWDYVPGRVYVWSAWTPFTFTLESSAAVTPTVSQFGLESVTGAAGGGLKTANPRVMGQVSGPSSLSGLTVQFDYGNGVVVGTATTDANGQFYYDPSPLPYGAVTIRAAPKCGTRPAGRTWWARGRRSASPTNRKRPLPPR